ncbi:MAG: hypothetical protein EAZ13_01550 [Sphingobacteriia bacterium]|nr:MAG: hypothetical protein EAZ41_00630 [Sphingobacteriia bacterium]TAG31581.1 MAG: hypothetical protein EAZ35_02705 [Sphingobacteriia bacterium]TAH09018.1 MAG: hypothetical protein EAZ13_01550 [Sphingobacteriia bacterium]
MVGRILSVMISLTCFCCSAPNLPITVAHQRYRIEKKFEPDTVMVQLVNPFAAEVKKTMGEVIGFANSTMYRKQPESGLGNMMADCMQQMAARKYGQKVDIGLINYEGIRAPIHRGNITVGSVYELMPFDNILVLQELSGVVLEKLIQHTASMGGWSVSAGSGYKIKDRKAVDIVIDGKPLNLKLRYTIANTDYIANGGDNTAVLKGIPQHNKGYLLRDILIAYIKEITAGGKPVEGRIENRVIQWNE